MTDWQPNIVVARRHRPGGLDEWMGVKGFFEDRYRFATIFVACRDTDAPRTRIEGNGASGPGRGQQDMPGVWVDSGKRMAVVDENAEVWSFDGW